MTVRAIAVVAAGLVLAFTGGCALGARDHNQPTRRPSNSVPIADDYPATMDGAVRAAEDRLRILGDQRLFDPNARAGLLDAAVTPSLGTRLEASIGAAARRLGPLDAVVSRIGVLSAHIEEFENERAVVSVWHVAVAGSTDPAAGLPVQALWRTARLTLVRADGTWLLDGGLDKKDVTSGPVPAFAVNQPAVSSLDDLARVGREYQGAP